MGISERKEREKEKLHQQILDGAMEIFLNEGYEKTSIRKIANRVEYSPATIYLYFKDKDEIFHELHSRAFEALFFTLNEAAATVREPSDRLRLLGRTYVQFAVENPELYDLMFILNEPMKALENDPCWDEGFATFDFLKALVQEAQEKGQLRSGNAETTSVSLWAHVHGLASLMIRQRFKMFPEEQVAAIIEASLEEMFTNFSITGPSGR